MHWPSPGRKIGRKRAQAFRLPSSSRYETIRPSRHFERLSTSPCGAASSRTLLRPSRRIDVSIDSTIFRECGVEFRARRVTPRLPWIACAEPNPVRLVPACPFLLLPFAARGQIIILKLEHTIVTITQQLISHRISYEDLCNLRPHSRERAQRRRVHIGETRDGSPPNNYFSHGGAVKLLDKTHNEINRAISGLNRARP